MISLSILLKESLAINSSPSALSINLTKKKLLKNFKLNRDLMRNSFNFENTFLINKKTVFISCAQKLQLLICVNFELKTY
jgi:hypothetical protein